eukprot:scaffold185761_cov22-Cyclotella_meneghiniana.AAC.2
MTSTNKAYKDEEDDWLEVSNNSNNNNDDAMKSSLELVESPNQDDDNDDDSYSTDDEEEEYELTSGQRQRSTRFSHLWHCPSRFQCITFTSSLLLLFLITIISRITDTSTDHRPPGAVGVGHSSYDTLSSRFLEEYEAHLTLYRHRASGAEFLAFVPDSSVSGSNHVGGKNKKGGSVITSSSENDNEENYYYDPKPDKVFGVAFRTKPESSTGVPHILEREYVYVVVCCWMDLFVYIHLTFDLTCV